MKKLSQLFVFALIFVGSNVYAGAAKEIGKCAYETHKLHVMSAQAGACWTHYSACKASSWITHENCGHVEDVCHKDDDRVKEQAGVVKHACI